MADNRFFHKVGSFKLKELAEASGSKLANEADADYEVIDVATLELAGNQNISFLSNPKYKGAYKETKAGAVIVAADMVPFAPATVKLLVAKDPYKAYAKVASKFYPVQNPEPGISSNAVIAKTAVLGKDVTIGPFVQIEDGAKIGDGSIIMAGSYIGPNVEIGNNTRISHGCTVTHTLMGNNCFIYPGVRIGQDGFGFVHDGEGHLKVPQLGRVIIGNMVEIGANTTIDRGASGDTTISDHCKIDNLVQIGHNVFLGKGCIIVAFAGIAGSTTLGDYVVVGGQVGIAGHLKIGSMAKIAAQSGVHRDLDPRKTYGGAPVMNILDWHRQTIMINKLTQRQDKKND